MQANIVITYYLDVKSFIFSFYVQAVKLNFIVDCHIQFLTAIEKRDSNSKLWRELVQRTGLTGSAAKGSRWPWKSKAPGDYFFRKARGFSTLSLPKLWLDAQEGWPRSLRLRSRPTQRPDLGLLNA